MRERMIVDHNGDEWSVSEIAVHYGAAGPNGELPSAVPWIRFRHGETIVGGPSRRGVDDMTDDELLHLLQRWLER